MQKRLLIIAVNLLFSLVLVESLSAFVLSYVVTEEITPGKETSKIIGHFPAQFRLSREQIQDEFPEHLPLARVGNFLGLDFDPVLGFRKDSALEWFGGTQENLQGKFFIITLGGSTTVGDNWPKYLIQSAAEQNVKQELVILNAGLWGNISFNELIYLNHWILPDLEKKGIRPNLVITMDGANDVWYRIMSYFLSQSEGGRWFDRYHGYHQQLNSEMERMGTIRYAFMQLLSNTGRGAYQLARHTVVLAIPHTMQMLVVLSKKVLQSGQPREMAVEQAKTNIRHLDESVEDKIVSAVKGSLLDFYGTTSIRGIPFAGYLQPVLLEPYYPHPVPKTFFFPNFNYEAMNLYRTNRFFTVLNGNYMVPTERLYGRLEKMYAQLSAQHKESFKSLAGIFYPYPEVDQLYEPDAVHYNLLGKKLIAQAVITDLLDRGLLTRH